MKEKEKDNEEILFSALERGQIPLEGVVEEIVRFVRREPGRFYKIIIGADSEAADPATIVTAVTIWRVGNGAIHFWTKSKAAHFPTMRDRIWAEAIRSITLAQEMRSSLQSSLGDEFFWDGNEIHVDIGENGPTRELIDGVVGIDRKSVV